MGIEPTADVLSPPPDLKSGGHTSYPGTSILDHTRDTMLIQQNLHKEMDIK